MDTREIGRRLRGLREERGQSKAYIARKLGISYSAICAYEYGERVPNDETKIKIAKYFGVSVEWLFFT